MLKSVDILIGLSVIMLTVSKVFLFDAAGLSGLYRVASFLGLGLCLIGIGYAYQRYEYSDIGTDGNRYVSPYPPAAASPTTSYVTGQYGYQPYTANIYYVLGTYKF